MNKYIIYSATDESVIEEITTKSINDRKLLDACLDARAEWGGPIFVFKMEGTFEANPTIVPVKECK